MLLAVLAVHPVLLAASGEAGPHAAHRRLAEQGRSLAGARTPTPGGLRPRPAAPTGPPDRVVYGYLPYWTVDVADVPWAHLTHLAIFDVGLEADGSLSDTDNWTDVAAAAVSLGRASGVKVHLCVTSFDGDTMDAVLASASRRAATVDALGDLVDAYGADGVNVDFEGLPSDRRADMVTFVRELRARVGEVVLATPAVDWSDAWDYASLAEESDGLFIMGYGYHWTGGDPGPNAPLADGDLWSPWTLAWSVEDYVGAGADPAKIILGLPTYGQEWPVSDSADVPASATGDGWSVTYVEAVADAAAAGRSYDAVSDTPYYARSASRQAWYDDATSLSVKMEWAVDQGLAGFGFWAIGYDGDDPALWAAVDAASHVDAPPDTGGGDTGGVDGGGGDTDPDGGGRPGRAQVIDGEEQGGCGCAAPGAGPVGAGAVGAGLGALALLAAAARARRPPG